MSDYRKIYEEHKGEIPKGWHVHHIDGDRSNNDISNLIAMSPFNHWIQHYIQGDTIGLRGKFIQNAGTQELSEKGRQVLSEKMSSLNIEMNSKRDYSNRTYEYCSGENHYNYKGLPTCLDCEKNLKDHRSKRCGSCGMKKRWADKKEFNDV